MARKFTRTYKKYLQDEDPVANAPHTSKWRMKKRIKVTGIMIQEAENNKNEADSYSENDSESTETVNDSDCGENPDEPQTSTADDEQKDVWYSTEASDWYQSEETTSQSEETLFWFDANEDPDDSNESSCEAENNQIEQENDEPLYKGASLSVAESALLILTFAMRHNLTGECLSDLLTLISFHCVTTSFIHTSLYKFKSYFSALKAPIVFHKFCCKCEYLVENSVNVCTVCNSDLSDKKNTSYFVEIPLLFQIQQLFQRQNFHKKLMHKFSKKKKDQDNIEDIYDGKLYRLMSAAGRFLSSFNNISLMWYTDGVPLFKSSKVSIWPLFLSINELPAQDRFKQENILFAGLWFGHSKPSMSCFLKPFHDVLNDFKDNGYQINCVHCSGFITVRGLLLCGTCDLPAKSMVLNTTQFNGKFGCPKCKQEGEVVKTGKGHTRVFPFHPMVDKPKRNHAEFIQHGDEAFAASKPVFGVKGPSWWVNCCLDIIDGTGIDYMHCVLLGLVRRLLQLWFDPKFSSEAFSISHLVTVADRKLSSIKPPYYIKRHPRDIKEQSKYWKASECRAWLFYYSIPVLFGLLKQNIFQHYLLLVEAVYILNLDSISRTDLKHCEELLIKYSCIFSALYGDQYMSANLHQLLHLCDQVEQLGPLWVYSCFSFESINGNLVKLFHGTQNPVIQMANTVSTMLKLPAFATKIKQGTPVADFYEKLISSKCHYKLGEKINCHAYVIGAKHLKKLDLKFADVIAQKTNFALGDSYMFYRVMLNGILYHSEKYNTYSRNSCTVIFNDNGEKLCGHISFYVKVYPICFCSSVTSCVCSAVYLAVIRKIKVDKDCAFKGESVDLIQAKLGHVVTGMLTNDYAAVSLNRIIGLGVFMTVKDENVCVVLPPNQIESD